MNQFYSFDPKSRVWSRPISTSFPYSDGDEIEDYLLTTLRSAEDVSSRSSELIAAIKDWPSEYHFSPARHNLLRFMDIGPAHRVLELGCGCGAITRYLGERGATVVAVEGSRQRATITAERCRDLSNVSVYCDNLAKIDIPKKFDFVTLIGVLEYARLFILGDDPIKECLQIAQSFLADDGVLIVAIENQLGLKYFNGCREDHIGIPYFGIHDLYDSNSPVTFGKYELESKLNAAEFGSIKFFYPFPDYKLPILILTAESLNHPNFHPADLFHRIISRDYVSYTRRVFHENLVWRPLIRNRLLPELANSFLVLARRSSTKNAPPKWLARIYSKDRLPAFSTETVFQLEHDTIIVAKRPTFPDVLQKHRIDGVDGIQIIHNPCLYAPYISGKLYATELQLILARGGDLADVANWAAPWVKRLITEAKQSLAGRMLPGDWLDAIPANFVRDNTDTLNMIDFEWQAVNAIPFSWVLIRGFVNTLNSCPLSPALTGITFKEVVNYVLRLLGHTELKDTDYQIATLLEDNLQNAISEQRLNVNHFAESIDGPTIRNLLPITFNEENNALRAEIAAQRSEIARIKSSVSWYITKPLRLLKNFSISPRKTLKELVDILKFQS